MMLALLALNVLVATGCASSINRVLADPARYRDRQVTLKGRVVDSYSVLDRGAYLLEDRTGRLWVVSGSGTPRKGAAVSVKGTVREGFNLGSLGDLVKVPGAVSGVVLIETSHKAQF